MQVDLDVNQGDVLNVVLQPIRRDPIQVEAIVWHRRRVRQRRTDAVSFLLGLVLSNAPPDFGTLLGLPDAAAAPPDPAPDPAPDPPSNGKKADPASHMPPAPKPARPGRAPAAKETAAPELAKPHRFRARVRMDGGMRTRSIIVFAHDEGEAREGAINETGPGWSILEIERV